MEKNLAPLDLEEFLFNFEDLEDEALELVSKFLKALPAMKNDIKHALNNKIPSDLERSAHTLKGTVSIFFAAPSRELAAKLETMGRENNLANAEEVLSELEIELEKLCKALEEWSSSWKNK